MKRFLAGWRLYWQALQLPFLALGGFVVANATALVLGRLILQASMFALRGLLGY